MDDATQAKDVEERARKESRRRRQERKKKQQNAFQTGVWDRCLYRVPGKQRFCAQYRSPHSTEYCATHMGASPCPEKGERVPCPIDPNHTVFEQQLSSHIKICNVVVREAQMEGLPYYSRGINSGPMEEGDQAPGDGNGCASWSSCEDGAAGFTGFHLDEELVRDVIFRVKAAHRAHVGELKAEVLDPPEVDALHRASAEEGTSFRKARHVLQQASIVGHMIKRGLLFPGTNNLYVEMGAGKGALGRAISVACPEAEMVMIERSAVRRKAENRLDRGSVGNASRARIDIRDLNMAGLPSLRRGSEGRAVVAVAKHLCGAATDLALRALLTLQQKQEIPGERVETGAEDSDVCPSLGDADVGVEAHHDDEIPSAVRRQRVGGVAIATCCHHACNWRDYSGRSFLERLGFTARDFDVMRRVSAWISLEPEAGARKNNRCEHHHAESLLKVPEGPSTPPPSLPKGCDRAGIFGDGPDDGGTYEGTAAGFLRELQGEHGGNPTEELDRCSVESGGDHGSEQQSLGAIGGLTAAEKAAAARECKRLIDRGRQAFLEGESGLRVEIVHFVDREVTPENALLLGFQLPR